VHAAGSSSERSQPRYEWPQHAGAVDLGKPTGANNESIDADLAREYGSSDQDGR
jgi:hypothetical protein